MLRDSLRLRLVMISGLGVAAALVATAGLLIVLFYAHAERLFDRHLYDHLEELAAASETTADGSLQLTWMPTDPRFAQPLSGWYWQIARQGEILLRSKSLLNDALTVTDPGSGHLARYFELHDSRGAELRAIMQTITLPETDAAFTVVVTGPHRDIDHDVSEFTSQVVVTLAALGLIMVAVFAVQISYSLKPLRKVRAALAHIRAGTATRLPESFPDEVRPMIQDFNALLDHKEKTIERARAYAGDLAHAIKNPLTVIHNETRALTGKRGDILRDHVAAVRAAIERHLSRSRAAGALGLPGSTADVRAVVSDVVFTLQRLYRAKKIRVDLEPGIELVFAGDHGDLEEMLGNLLDNACKWARSTITLEARHVGDRLIVTIEDDGPGVPEGLAEQAIERGQRLDPTMPGFGLGLAIVRDLANLYHGDMRLDTSRFGGLAVVLTLPSANAPPAAERTEASGAQAGD